MTSREIHGLAFRLQREGMQEPLTEPQEWLWESLMHELEWRRRNTRWPQKRCSCELCWDPFEDPLAP